MWRWRETEEEKRRDMHLCISDFHQCCREKRRISVATGTTCRMRPAGQEFSLGTCLISHWHLKEDSLVIMPPLQQQRDEGSCGHWVYLPTTAFVLILLMTLKMLFGFSSFLRAWSVFRFYSHDPFYALQGLVEIESMVLCVVCRTNLHVCPFSRSRSTYKFSTKEKPGLLLLCRKHVQFQS